MKMLSRLKLALKFGKVESELPGRDSSHQSSRRLNSIMRLVVISLVISVIIGGFVFHAQPVRSAPADCFWVLGNGNINDAAGHWATSDGGAPGAGNLPDQTSNVHFTANSNAGGGGGSYSVTRNAQISCNDFIADNPSSGLLTFTNTSAINIYGSLTLDSGVDPGAGSFYMRATTLGETITTNGAEFGGMTIYGSGSWQLQDDLTIHNGNLIFSGASGTFDTNSKTVTLYGTLNGDMWFASGSPTLILGASTIYTNYWCSDSTTYTLNAGTSTINMAPLSGNYSFQGAGKTYYNAVLNTGVNDSVSITGANTFNNLTLSGVNIADDQIYLAANQTVTGTFTTTGYSASRRLLVSSNGLHTKRTITAANVSATNTLFRDIVGAGAGSWNFSARNDIGDCGGNSGITFPLGIPVYAYAIPGNVNWTNANNWSSSAYPSAVAGSGRIPLPQDIAVFDQYSIGAPTTVISFDVSNLSGINALNITNNPKFSGTTDYFYNSINLGTCQWDVTTATYFYGQTAQTVSGDFSSTTGTDNLYFDLQGGSMVQVGTLTTDGSITLTSGIWSTNNYAITSATFASSTTTYTRALVLGTSIYTLNSTGAVTKWNVASTNLSIPDSAYTLVFTNSGTNTSTFTGGGMTYRNITVGGAGAYSFTLGSAFSIASGGTFYIDRSLANKTIAGNFTVTIPTASGLSMPASGTRTVTITNTDFSIARGTVSVQYMSISGSAASGGALYFAGATPPSVNGGGNSGWIFSAPYLVVQTMTASGATLNGNISGLGGATAQDRGFIWNGASMTTPNAATAPSASGYSNWAEGAGAYGEGNFSRASGVATAGTWYFMAAAQDASNNWYYGAELTFTYVTPVAGTGTMPSSNNTMIGYLATFNGTLPSQYNNVNLFTRNIMDYVNVTQPANFYSENMMPTIFGASFINTMLDAGNWPRSLFWFPFFFFTSVAVGFIIFRFSKSLLIQCVSSECILAIGVASGVLPAWVLAIFPIEALAVLVASKHTSI